MGADRRIRGMHQINRGPLASYFCWVEGTSVDAGSLVLDEFASLKRCVVQPRTAANTTKHGTWEPVSAAVQPQSFEGFFPGV